MSGELAVELEAEHPIPLRAAFTVAPGELLALVGPSGSGKTTILRCIAGLHRPSGGSIRCGGDLWLDMGLARFRKPQHRRVGLVFQDYALFPHMTAADNLRIAMDGGGGGDGEDRARQLLEQVRLGGLQDRYPAQLSGGQQQRVAVARALARDPLVLLLDEPFSAVDMMTRQRLQRELALLRQTIDIPMLLVTHDLQEAQTIADRICVLHEGTSLQVDEPEELFRRPRSPRVARLLGCHNVFRGRVVYRDVGPRLLWGEQELELAGSPGRPDGTEVAWYIPDSDILLHRRGRPSRGEAENPVKGVVEECVGLGAQTSVVLRCQDAETRIRLDVSTHAARRNGLEPGVEATVSLLAKGIHCMMDSPADGR